MAKGSENRTEAVVPEVVEAGGNLTRMEGGTERAIAAQLTAAYRRAEGSRGAFMREAVAFGVALIEVERSLVTAVTKLNNCEKQSKRGRNGEGRPNSGLEAWLAKNCPEIGYPTAKSYKMYAGRVIAMMGGETNEVLAALRSPNALRISYEPSGAETDAAADVETVSDEVIDAREALFTEATSRRRLEQMWFRFAGEDGGGAGRPKGSGAAADGPVRKLSRADEAKAIWNRLLQDAAKSSVRDSVPLLGEAETRVAYDALGDLRAALKRHMEEFG